MSRIFVHNRWLTVPGVLDPDSSPEPSVEWVAGANRSMVDIIGTHMLLQVPSRDSVVRSWG
jgi:hypothetical protein